MLLSDTDIGEGGLKRLRGQCFECLFGGPWLEGVNVVL